MAKLNIAFDDKNYVVDESSLSAATDSLKQHLSISMNGTGESIDFGGTFYNIDSVKLETAKNDFIQYLGSIAGNDRKVVVGATEYFIDNAKTSGAIERLQAFLSALKPQLAMIWQVKTWNGYTNFSNTNVWINGDKVYLSCDGVGRQGIVTPGQYILDKSTSTWTPIDWYYKIGEEIVCSSSQRISSSTPKRYGHKFYRTCYYRGEEETSLGSGVDFVYNADTGLWEETVADILTFDEVNNVFSDGGTKYASDGFDIYILDKVTDTWQLWKTTVWNESADFLDAAVWKDGNNVYYSLGEDNQYILNNETCVWERHYWNGFSDIYSGSMWRFGDMVIADGAKDGEYYILNNKTNSWEPITIDESVYGSSLSWTNHWTDGENLYWSKGAKHYVLT